MTILLRNPTRIEVPWTKRQEGILIADQAAAIERINREGSLVQRLVKKTQDGTLGKASSEPMDTGLEEEMAVTVGDTINHHHYPTPEPVAVAAPAPTPAPTTNLTPWLALLSLLMVALLTLAICWIAFGNQTPVAATPPTITPIFDVSGPPTGD